MINTMKILIPHNEQAKFKSNLNYIFYPGSGFDLSNKNMPHKNA